MRKSSSKGSIMGFFDRLFGRQPSESHPTDSWDENCSHSLEVDLDRGTFGGVRLEEPIEALQWLGPADARSRTATNYTDENFYIYEAKGIQIVEYEGKFRRLHVELSDKNSFSDPILANGEDLDAARETFETLEQKWGKPVDSGPVELNYNDFRDYFVKFKVGVSFVSFWTPLSDGQELPPNDSRVSYMTMSLAK